MFSGEHIKQATALLATLRDKKMTIATAESCTGGLIVTLLTEIPGSSDVVDRGYVTYSNKAKQDLLGVPERLLTQYGAVSGPVASAMAEGAIVASGASIAVAVTGIAGPGGGTARKPVGLVHVAVAVGQAKAVVQEHMFTGNRQQVRLRAVEAALALLQKSVK